MLTTWNAAPMLDRVFDDVMRSAFGYAAPAHTFAPAVDVIAKDDALVFKLDVPGLKQEELDITLHERVLTVKGARRCELGEHDKVSLGRAYGEFTVSYELPDSIDGERLSADLSDGVLTLHVPKHPRAQPRKISIGAGGGSGGAGTGRNQLTG